VASRGIGVPPRYRAALESLAPATPEQIEKLVELLNAQTQHLSTSTLADQVSEALPDTDPSTATRIIETLVSLIAQEESRGISRESLAVAVAHSDTLELPDDARERLAAHLRELMAIRSLRIALKAHDLMTEHQRVFSAARIFTDVRPVFGDDPRAPPVGSVIFETLKIEFFTESLSRAAFYVALDRLDLESLKEVVDRALEKTTALRKDMLSRGIPTWEYESELSDADSD
jgi:hypothetical protein